MATTKTRPELDEFVALSAAKLGLSYDASDLKALRKKAPADIRVNVARLARMRDYNAAPVVAEAATWTPEPERPRGDGNGSSRTARPAVAPAKLNFAASLLRRLWVCDPETGEELVAELPTKSIEQLDRLIDNLKILVANMEASEPQVALLRRLWGCKMQRNAEADAAFEAKLPTITASEATKLIDMLDRMPDLPREQQTRVVRKYGPEVEADGMYRNPKTGEIFKVQIAHQGSGKLYAKKLTKLDEPRIVRGKETYFEFVYTTGAIMRIKPEWQLTLEDAKEFGDMYGCCMRCGTVLTDDQSISDGVGPICKTKGWCRTGLVEQA